MKIVTIVGARPQFIKMAVVSNAIRKLKLEWQEVYIHTGQHFDQNMSEIFFNELDIRTPNYNLSISGGSHGENTGRMIEGVEKILLEESPDLVILYGDTDSTLAGAIAASKIGIKIAHIEAGLRSFNKNMPEEINRILTDHVSDYLFTPTPQATRNLLIEGVNKNKIHEVGDVMLDAALFFMEKAKSKSNILNKLGLTERSYNLLTIHRKESTEDQEVLSSILLGIQASSLPIVWPIHPRTKSKLALFNIKIPNHIIVIDPVGYLDMIMLEKNAIKIITDSGGVQKEAFFFKVPCLTVRTETEWVELVDSGANFLVGHNSQKISDYINQEITFPSNLDAFYGSGHASLNIVTQLLS